MTIKQYALPSEEIAKELILALAHEENELPFNKVTITDTTHGIVCLGFQHKYEVNLETDEHVLVKEATTYDVDVAWKEINEVDEDGNVIVQTFGEWDKYEIRPKTPNHVFA